MSAVVRELVAVSDDECLGGGIDLRVAAGEVVELHGADEAGRRLIEQVLGGRRRATFGALLCEHCSPAESRHAAPRPVAPTCWRRGEHLRVVRQDGAGGPTSYADPERAVIVITPRAGTVAADRSIHLSSTPVMQTGAAR